ncbi:hypothetical protein I4U23_019681 [Adineta vaga]|nr:hypothetical protein I4U23_019681 [Adineta vaga]
MSWEYNSYYWQRGVNQYGNRYDYRGEGAARGGSYHYSNNDGSYYYQNSDGSTYYSSPEGCGTYTLPHNNLHYDESSDSGEETKYVSKPKTRKPKQTKIKKATGKVTKAKKVPTTCGKQRSRR